jgi:hypothetical protein
MLSRDILCTSGTFEDIDYPLLDLKVGQMNGNKSDWA